MAQHVDVADRFAAIQQATVRIPKDRIGTHSSTVIYRATLKELLIASVSYGYFAIYGLGALSAIAGLIDTLNLSEAAAGELRAHPTAAAITVLLGSACAGALTTLVRFHAFTVKQNFDGSISLSFGMVRHVDRVIHDRSIVGIGVQANPLERLLGRQRLSLITVDTSRELGANVMLPSLPVPVVSAFVGESFPNWSPVTVGRNSSSLNASILQATFLTAAVSATFLAYHQLPWPIYATTFLAAAICGCVYLVGRICTSTVERAERSDQIRFVSDFVLFRERTVSAERIATLRAVGIWQRPILMSVHYYAGGPRLFIAPQFGPAELREIQRVVATADQHRTIGRSREV